MSYPIEFQEVTGDVDLPLWWERPIAGAMMRLKLVVISVFALLLPCLQAEEVQVRSFRYRTNMRLVGFAEKSEIISNPLWWPQIKSIAPDGSFVESGAVITEFDTESVNRWLGGLLLEKKVIDARLRQKLTELRNKDMGLQDSLAEMTDNLAVLKVQMERYRAMPDADKVKIAAGRHRLAGLSLEAAKNDLLKAQKRYEREMISRIELEKYRSELRRKEAEAEHTSKHLQLTSQAASPLTLRKLELQIENATMEIQKLEHEIAENAGITEIRKKGAAAQKEIIERRIKEKQDDLGKTRVTAPISGYLIYERRFKERVLQSGDKMRKNFVYAKIPDPTTLAFKGVILESDRKFFSPGDEALLRAAGRPSEVVKGKVLSISKFSHDFGEKEEAGWGERKKSGVMVYDIVVKPEKQFPWLKVGMHADCELVSSEEYRGPSISTSFVKEKAGKLYLSFGGVYREVTGRVMNGYLLLDEKSLAGKTVDLVGEFPGTSKDGADDAGAGKVRWFGSLIPANTTDVTVKRIFRWQKVSWLMPEDTVVKKGDVVVKLDPRETDEDIQKWESRYREAESNRQALGEQGKLEESEAAFRLKREGNLLEIARINLEILQRGRDWSALFDAELQLRQGEIRLDDINQRISRLEKMSKDFVSLSEKQMLIRDQRRASLQKESAAIRLAGLKRGSDELRLRKAEFALLTSQLKMENLKKEVETGRFRREQNLRRVKKSEAHVLRRLDQRREWKKNLTLIAPCDGVLQYAKIYNNGVISKVNIGSMVGYRFAPVKIADISRMYIRVEVSERYFASVKKDMPVEVRIPSLTDEVLDGKVSEVEFIFENKRRKDTKVGLYSSHENLGKTIFFVRVQVAEQKGVKLKPGAVANVTFPFER